MYKRILIPLDGSSLSESVLPIAVLLANAFGCGIELIFVISIPMAEIPAKIKSQALSDGECYLKERLQILSRGVRKEQLSSSVQIGHPADRIIEQAELHEKTLILMSSHGYSGVQKLLLGSVTSKVVQATRTPILVIPVRAMEIEGGLVELERMIVPLDGSKLAESVLPHALAFCEALDLEMILIRSYNPNFPGSSVRMHDVSQIVHDSAERYIQAKLEELREKGSKRISSRIFRGHAAEQIIDFAMATPNSMTAMCTHGRHGIGRWMLGSVTNKVVQCTEEPVLVIRCIGTESG